MMTNAGQCIYRCQEALQGETSSHWMLMLSMWQASADDRSKIKTKFVKNVEIVEFHDHI